MARKLKYNDEEGGMAKSQLHKIETYAKKLNEMIHPEDELEAWVQSKLSVVSAYMGDIKHYLDYELKKYGYGGGIKNNLEMYEVEFTWDKKGEDDYDSRKVVIYAESIEEAQKIAKDKYAPYYDGFKIVEVEREEEDEEDEKDEKDEKDKEDKSFSTGGKVKRKKWIQDALSGDNKGELRKKAKRKGLLRGDENLSMTDLKKLQKMGGKTAKQAHLAETLRKFKRGGGMGDVLVREQGSTYVEDMKDAEMWLGKEKWDMLSTKDQISTMEMLKSKGYIGYPDWEEDIETISAMQYKRGGGVSFKERCEIDSVKIAKAYQKVLDKDFSDEEYEKYQKIVIETKIPKEQLQKIETYISTTPKSKQRDIDIFQYWGMYATGGGVKRKDLFETPNKIPKKVREILDMYQEEKGDDMDYEDTESMLKEVEAVGYTFDYGLDNVPMGLRPKGVKLSELEGYEDEEYAKGGNIEVGDYVYVKNNPNWESGLGTNKSYLRKVKMIIGEVGDRSFFFTDGSNASEKYVHKAVTN